VSFLQELKRRNVVRVGIAYAVGAWLVLQLTEVLSELLKFPDSVGPIVVSVVAIGLPIVLVTAWVFELTPDGLKRETEVDRNQSITASTGKKLNVTIFALTAIALAYFIWESRFSDRQAPPAIAIDQQTGTALANEQAMALDPATEDVDKQSIAVLPFENRSNLEQDQFFVDGVHDDLLTTLARIGSLKVISRTSVRAYADTGKTIPEIASELGVATIMEGAVQRVGNTVRINVQLIDASTDQHLWAEIFDREMTTDNLFAIQSEISEKIAGALKTTLTEDEQRYFNRKPTENLGAYNAYLRGRQLAVKRNADDLEQALALFQEAVDLDPEFAEGWSAYAMATLWAANYGTLDPQEAFGLVKERAEKAMALNPELGEPWLIRAVFKNNGNDRQGAEADYQRALELSPNNALVHHWYANFLDDSSARLDEAFFHALRATELDPISSIDQLELADLYQKLGQFEEAEKHIQLVIDRDPEFSTSYQYMGLLKRETGQLDEALRMVLRSQAFNPRNFRLVVDEAWIILELDATDRLQQLRRKIEETENPLVSFMLESIIAIHRGNPKAAMENLLGAAKIATGAPFIKWFMGNTQIALEDYEAARLSMQEFEPRLWQRDSWRQAYPESMMLACIVAALMNRTGDPDLGNLLASEVIAYFENELPNYLAFPERYDATICYLETGQISEAVELVEKRLNNDFLDRWWYIEHDPLRRMLWNEPRVQNALDALAIRLKQQREQVRLWESEGTL
jgi:TolB-like protein/Tfp pilus assembly protein PilF